MSKRISKFQKQVNVIENFRATAERQKGQAYRTGKGIGLTMSAFGKDGFKPSMSLAKILRKHTKNLIKEAIKVEQKRDIELIRTPNTTAHRYMYKRGYVDEYGVLLRSRQKVLQAWTSTTNKKDLDKAYFNIEESTFTNERDYAKFLIIRGSQVGVDIELVSRFVNLKETIYNNFDTDLAETLYNDIEKIVNDLKINERRWFLAMLDTGQNGFSFRVVYEVLKQSDKSDIQKKAELFDTFKIAIERTKTVTKKFTYGDYVENTKHQQE